MIAQALAVFVLLGGAPAAMAASPAATAPTLPGIIVSSPYPLPEMTMAEVRQVFGPPELIRPAVPATAQGPHKPPITRWVYPDFIVYFERNLALHTVVVRPRLAPRIYPAPAASGG